MRSVGIYSLQMYGSITLGENSIFSLLNKVTPCGSSWEALRCWYSGVKC